MLTQVKSIQLPPVRFSYPTIVSALEYTIRSVNWSWVRSSTGLGVISSQFELHNVLSFHLCTASTEIRSADDVHIQPPKQKSPLGNNTIKSLSLLFFSIERKRIKRALLEIISLAYNSQSALFQGATWPTREKMILCNVFSVQHHVLQNLGQTRVPALMNNSIQHPACKECVQQLKFEPLPSGET